MTFSRESSQRYLTKSRFKMAIECPTKLFYATEGKKVYFDRNQDNDFLQALADGGQQIGELAKFKYHDDPIGDAITVGTLVHEDALGQTKRMLEQPGRVVIAEAALAHENFFVRVDLLVRDENAKTIDIIEVKSKAVKQSEIANDFKQNGEHLPDWLPYLYDLAYQVMVARLAIPDYTIRAKLVLIDGEEICDVDGLHQQFPVSLQLDETQRSRTVVSPAPQLSRVNVGDLKILREVDVTKIVEDLLKKPIDNPNHIPAEQAGDIRVFATWASDVLMGKERFFIGVSKSCKSCQFRAPVGSTMKSGVHECWKDAISQGLIHGDVDDMDLATPLSIDLWGGAGGSRSFANDLLNSRRAFLRDIEESDIATDKMQEPGKMTPFERRLAQIHAVKYPETGPVTNKERLAEMDSWDWPWHMIDFETSAPALPFFSRMKPYETLAFQFSHHIMEKGAEGSVKIRHQNQWISFEAGQFPSIDFVRALKKALMPDNKLRGTVFRYHHHENTVLRRIRSLLVDDGLYSAESDAPDLVSFIDLITVVRKKKEGLKNGHQGDKAMVDLHRLVQEGYYSRHAGGSITLKHILPAILRDAPRMAALFGTPGIYGHDLRIKSLNFSDHVWLDPRKESDPYKTLPPVFGAEHGDLNGILFRLLGDAGEDETAIADGGLAMTAYNYTQFSSLKDSERQSIVDALLRYCELDTFAMVMLVMGLHELRGQVLKVT